MAKRQIPLATPGEILPEEFLKPLGVTQYRLAKEIGVPQRRIGEIVAGKRSITADTAARLGVYFSMEAEFWLNLQAHYDLALTREALAENLAAIQPLAAAAQVGRRACVIARRYLTPSLYATVNSHFRPPEYEFRSSSPVGHSKT